MSLPFERSIAQETIHSNTQIKDPRNQSIRWECQQCKLEFHTPPIQVILLNLNISVTWIKVLIIEIFNFRTIARSVAVKWHEFWLTSSHEMVRLIPNTKQQTSVHNNVLK